MPPPFEAEVVSPELALVDPELAERARAALPPRHGRLPASSTAVALAPASRRGRRLATPALTVLATAAASMIVTAFTSFEQAQGEPPRGIGSVTAVAPVTARAAPAGSPAVASAQAPFDAAIESSPASSTTSGRVGAVGGRTPGTLATSPAGSGVAAPDSPVPAPGEPGTTIVWDEAADAAGYEVELRRGGAVIHSSTSTAPVAVVPRTWVRNGTAFVLRPEDQLYVWPVVGRRRGSPVVDGALAMDATDIARFIQRRQSSRP